MKERLMVHGSKFWIADRDCKVLVDHYDTKEEAKEALRELEQYEMNEGYYIPYYYKIVEGFLYVLRAKGYSTLADYRTIADL